MGRYDDHAPVRHTCPKIDGAQSDIDSAINYLTELRDELEVLRKENAELREWGNEECRRANDFESDYRAACKEIESLKDDVDYLNKQVRELENQD